MLYVFSYYNYDDHQQSKMVESDEDLSYPNINSHITSMIREQVGDLPEEFINHMITNGAPPCDVYLVSKGHDINSTRRIDRLTIASKLPDYEEWLTNYNPSIVDYLIEKGIAREVEQPCEVDIDNPTFLC